MTLLKQKKICSSEHGVFYTIFSGNVTDDHFVALKQCLIVATIVASAQLWPTFKRLKVTSNKRNSAGSLAE